MTKRKYELGTILVDVWGYEQTNIDFYQVVRATESSCWLRQIEKNYVKDISTMSSIVEPVKDEFSRPDENPVMKRFTRLGVKSDLGYSYLQEFNPDNKYNETRWA
ncbi:hypothetical protein KNP65_03700 [Latilactobacillus curvatus]|nr:hypothetical protein [Latilactobacillus curvatus]MDG2979042.1 hypothetical protein [Latilactobacillus curvatus]